MHAFYTYVGLAKKSSFSFFYNILWKSPNKLFGQSGPKQSLKLNNHHCKRVQNSVLACSFKNDKVISVRFQGKPLNITVIQVYAPTSNAEEAKQFYDNLQDFLELTQKKKKKDVFFIIGDWNAKVGSQEISGVTGKFGLGVQNEAGQRLTEFCQEIALVIENTLFQQHKR